MQPTLLIFLLHRVFTTIQLMYLGLRDLLQLLYTIEGCKPTLSANPIPEQLNCCWLLVQAKL